MIYVDTTTAATRMTITIEIAEIGDSPIAVMRTWLRDGSMTAVTIAADDLPATLHVLASTIAETRAPKEMK